MDLDSFDAAVQRIVEFRDDRDWGQFHKPKDLAAALSIEAAELLELFLWRRADEIEELVGRQDFKILLEEELGDVLIYALLLCHETGVEPGEAIAEKLCKNEERYPVDLARGTAKKYDELDS